MLARMNDGSELAQSTARTGTGSSLQKLVLPSRARAVRPLPWIWIQLDLGGATPDARPPARPGSRHSRRRPAGQPWPIRLLGI